jgi:hypothetical protein
VTAAAVAGRTGFEAPGISSVYFPHLDPANAAVAEWTYLACLRPPYKQAAHYLGSAFGLAARLRQHGTSEGARLLEVQAGAGGSFVLTRTWPSGRAVEAYFKAQRQSPKLCPRCTPNTRRGVLPPSLRAPKPRAVLASRAAAGRRWARHFLAERAGWTADEIEQDAALIQTPYFEGPRRTPEGDAEQAAFGRVIEAALAALRAPVEVAS